MYAPPTMTHLPNEILDLIMSHVKGWSCVLPWNPNNGTLASAARVCRTWHELATRYLWQEGFLLHVLRLLPRDAWHFVEICSKNNNNHYDAPESFDHACLHLKAYSHNPSELCKPVFTFRRSIKASEWEHLLPYTRKIRTFGVYNELYLEERSSETASLLGRMGHGHAGTSCRPTMMATNVCLQLQETLVPLKFPLFPALCELYIDSIITYQWGIWEAFASSKLKMLRIDRNYRDTLRPLRKRMIEPTTLAALVNLKSTTICHVDEAVWGILSTLPHLTSLTITIDQPFSSDQPANRAAHFTKLTALSVMFEGGYCVRALRAVLSSACTGLASLRISIFEPPDLLDEGHILLSSYVCSLCSKHLDKHILKSLYVAFVKSCTKSDLRSISFENTIVPLLNFNALKTLCLTLDSADLRIEPDWLGRILEDLPRLDYLSLEGCCIPVQGLQVLAKHPSPPQSISVTMTDVDDIPAEETWNTLPSSIGKLANLGLKLREDDRKPQERMDRYAAYARVLFPKAQRVILGYPF